jgi:hypothetical protein
MSVARVKGADRGFEKGSISSITVAVGDILAYDRSNHVLILALSTSSAEDIAGVAVAAATTADTEVLYQRITANDEFVATSTNNSDDTHNYQRMIIGAGPGIINNTGSDSTSDAAVFMQLGAVGAAASKKIRGKFIVTGQDRA